MALEHLANADFGRQPVSQAMNPMQMPDFTKPFEWEMKAMEIDGKKDQIKALANANAQKEQDAYQKMIGEIKDFERVDEIALQPIQNKMIASYKDKIRRMHELTQGDPLAFALDSKKKQEIEQLAFETTSMVKNMPNYFASQAKNLATGRTNMNAAKTAGRHAYTKNAVVFENAITGNLPLTADQWSTEPLSFENIEQDRIEQTSLGALGQNSEKIQKEWVDGSKAFMFNGKAIVPSGSHFREVTQNAPQIRELFGKAREVFDVGEKGKLATHSDFLMDITNAPSPQMAIEYINNSAKGGLFGFSSADKYSVGDLMERVLRGMKSGTIDGKEQGTAIKDLLSKDELESVNKKLKTIESDAVRKQVSQLLGIENVQYRIKNKNGKEVDEKGNPLMAEAPMYDLWFNNKVSKIISPLQSYSFSEGTGESWQNFGAPDDGSGSGDSASGTKNYHLADAMFNVDPALAEYYAVFATGDDDTPLSQWKVAVGALPTKENENVSRIYADPDFVKKNGLNVLGQKLSTASSDIAGNIKATESTGRIMHIPVMEKDSEGKETGNMLYTTAGGDRVVVDPKTKRAGLYSKSGQLLQSGIKVENLKGDLSLQYGGTNEQELPVIHAMGGSLRIIPATRPHLVVNAYSTENDPLAGKWGELTKGKHEGVEMTFGAYKGLYKNRVLVPMESSREYYLQDQWTQEAFPTGGATPKRAVSPQGFQEENELNRAKINFK